MYNNHEFQYCKFLEGNSAVNHCLFREELYYDTVFYSLGGKQECQNGYGFGTNENTRNDIISDICIMFYYFGYKVKAKRNSI